MIFNITDPEFGALSDQHGFDNTPCIQKALDKAEARGGGTVLVPDRRFWYKGALRVGHGVTIAGEHATIPDPMWRPAEKAQGSTLLPTNESEPAITFEGSNGGMCGLMIAYPNQRKTDDPNVGNLGPIPYPPTIVSKGSNTFDRLLLSNSYIGMRLLCGRNYVQNSHIGGLLSGVEIDNAWDVCRIDNTLISAWWIQGFPPFTTGLDFWVVAHGTGIIARKADGLQLSKLLIFGKNVAIDFGPSATVTDGAVSGTGTDVNIDSCRHGVVVSATEERVGFSFHNLLLGPYWDGPLGHAIWLKEPPIASAPPKVSVWGGSIRHQWARKSDGTDWAFRVDGHQGRLSVRGVIGYDVLLPRL